MFGILKDFVETIRMEIFGLKAEAMSLKLKTDVEHFRIDEASTEIIDESVSVEIEGFSMDDSIEIVDGGLDSGSFEIESGSFEDPKVSVSEIFESVGVETQSLEFDHSTQVMEELLDIENPEVLNVEKFTVIDRSDISLSVLWRMTFEPRSVVEKEKVLIAIERFLRRYGRSPRSLKFLGYYRGVPKSGIESITFIGNRMVLRLKPGAFPREKIDVVAFKTDRGIELEVV